MWITVIVVASLMFINIIKLVRRGNQIANIVKRTSKHYTEHQILMSSMQPQK